jgi:acetyltransferase-like isoleucine patch superfamily enzyme
MGRHSFCGYDCDILNTEIGSFTSIANCVVIGGARHPIEWVGMSPVFYSGRDSVKKKFSTFSLEKSARVVIGNDVWIGHSALLLAGIEVGHGAVVGAGSVVTKNVPPYAVVVGNPARIIKYRFDPEVVEKLMASSWWNLRDEEIQVLSKDIRNPLRFIEALGRG